MTFKLNIKAKNMYCRNCGKEVKENSVACLSCGFPPLLENKYCQECGTETNEKQIICIKCGCSLGNGAVKSTSGENLGAEYEGLYCSSDDKIIFGLCGGLAHKFGLQASIVRFIVFLSLWFFIGWLYFVGPFLPKYPTKNS